MWTATLRVKSGWCRARVPQLDAGLSPYDGFRVSPGRGCLGLEHPAGGPWQPSYGPTNGRRYGPQASLVRRPPASARVRQLHARELRVVPAAGARPSRRSAATLDGSERTYGQTGRREAGTVALSVASLEPRVQDLAAGALRRTTMMSTWSMSVEPATSPVYDVN